MIRVRRVKRTFEVGENDDSPIVVEETLEETDSGGFDARDGATDDYFNDNPESIWRKIGRYCVYAIAGLVPLWFLPFTVSQVETSKFILVGALTLASAVAFLVESIEKRTLAYPRSGITVAVLAVLVVFGVSAAFSVSPSVSFLGNLSDPGSFVTMALCAILFFLTTYFIRKNHIGTFIKIVGAGIAFSAAYAIFQSFGIYLIPFDFAKTTGFNSYGSLYGWGITMAAALAVISVLPFERLERHEKTFTLIVGILAMVSLLILNYNLIWVSLAFLMVMISSARFVARQSLGLPMLIGIVAVFLALVSSRLPALANLPLEIRPNLSSSFSVAKETLWGSRALNGSGPSTFSYDYDLYRPVSLNQTAFWSVRFSQGYNYFVTVLAEAGILGLLSLAFLLFMFLKFFMRSFAGEHMLPLASGLLLFFVSWMFYPIYFSGMVLLFMGLGLMMTLSGREKVISMEEMPPSKAFIGFMGAVLLIALCLTGFYFIGQKYFAAYKYGQGIKAYAAGDLDRSLANINSSIKWDANSDVYMRTMSQLLLADAERLAAEKGTEAQAEVQTRIKNVVQAAVTATVLNPADSINWINAGNIYESLILSVGGADGFAVQNYLKAAELQPASPSNPLSAARAFMVAAQQYQSVSQEAATERYNEAKKMLEKTLELKPDLAQARFYLAQIFLREGDFQSAVAKTEEIKSMNPLDAGVAFQLGILYYDAAKLDQARMELERAVALSPDYSNARYFLGLIFDRKGMADRALEQFERIADLNPANEEVKKIVSNLKNGKRALEEIVPPLDPPEDRTEVPVPDEEE